MEQIIMEETIAAISTAFGEGGIGIVRMSGLRSKEILERVFVSKSEIKDRRLTYGHIVDPDTGETVDEVMAVFMRAPYTYTKEDIVEIDTHGSVISLKKTLSLLLRCGARHAEKGEFTKRAFLNGRLDLAQAEAVMDIVSAGAECSYKAALGQLGGRLSKEINDIRVSLLDLLTNVAVNIDYPDEDIEELLYDDLVERISSISDEICKLLASADTGRMIREGIRIAIAGRPNVGKSSLMNALLRESRAIVTEIPGTTRDTIEEDMSIRGLPVRLIDTAGIRATDDEIERIGIERARSSADRADLVIFILDSSVGITENDIEIFNSISSEQVIVLVNKCDIANIISTDDIKAFARGADVIVTSMTERTGIDKLEDKIEEMVYRGKLKQSDSAMVTNARHEELLREALEALDGAGRMAAAGEALDFVDMDLRQAYESLGKITGDTVEEDILDEVFSKFCLGK